MRKVKAMGNIISVFNDIALMVGYATLTTAAWLTLFIWLDVHKQRKQQAAQPDVASRMAQEAWQDFTADEAKAYAQFKEWLTQFNRNVKYNSQETIRLFQVWREYVPDAPIECRNSGELEEPA